MNDCQDEPTREQEPTRPEGAEEGRRPYEPPRLRSGPAFEKVVLASGCNFGIFDCTIPC